MKPTLITTSRKQLLLAIVALLPYSATLNAAEPNLAVTKPVAKAAGKAIVLPERIPANCLNNAAQRSKVPSIALLAIMKHESNDRVGVIGHNKNGPRDTGPPKLNKNGKTAFREKECQNG